GGHLRDQIAFEQLDPVVLAQDPRLDHPLKLGDGQPVKARTPNVLRRWGNSTDGHLKTLLAARRCTTPRRAATTSSAGGSNFPPLAVRLLDQPVRLRDALGL